MINANLIKNPNRFTSVYYNMDDKKYYFEDLGTIPLGSIYVTHSSRINCLNFIKEIEDFRNSNPQTMIELNGYRI